MSKTNIEDLTQNPECGDGIVTVLSAGRGLRAVVATISPAKATAWQNFYEILRGEDFINRNRYDTRLALGEWGNAMFLAADAVLEKEIKIFLRALSQSGLMLSPIVCDLSFYRVENV